MPGRRRTRSGLTQNKLKQYIKKSLPYTRKLRSSTPMEYDPDTQRIRARLDNYATPQEIAEEAYRVCRKNAELRKEVCLTLLSGIFETMFTDYMSSFVVGEREEECCGAYTPPRSRRDYIYHAIVVLKHHHGRRRHHHRRYRLRHRRRQGHYKGPQEPGCGHGRRPERDETGSTQDAGVHGVDVGDHW